MKSIFFILPNTSKSLAIISNEYREDLALKNILIYIFSGIILHLFTIEISIAIGGLPGLGMEIIFLMTAIVLSMAGGFIVSFLLYHFSQWLGGVAEKIDIQATFAHSLIPVIISNLFLLIFFSEIMKQEVNNISTFRNGLMCTGLFFQFKILLQGVKKFNCFSWWNTFCVVSPYFLFKLILGFLFLSYN